MAIIILVDIEHNKQEDHILQQVIYTNKEVIEHWSETEVY